jgi:predicted transcriptional regulator
MFNMKINIRLFLLVFSLMYFASCGGPNQAELDQQQQEWEAVMAIHDEVMPKISEMNQISRELKKVEERETELFETYQDRILGSKQKLEDAEEAMFSWMNEIKQLDKLRADKSHEEILAYLAEEKVKITAVKEAMLESLEDGLALLSEFEALSQEAPTE